MKKKLATVKGASAGRRDFLKLPLTAAAALRQIPGFQKRVELERGAAAIEVIARSDAENAMKI